MLPNSPARRRPAWRRSALYLALVVVLGVAFWFTYNSVQTGQSWTYSQLIVQAQVHHVVKLEITGNQGVAVDDDGVRHPVTLPGDTTALADQLAAERVEVVYESQGSIDWLAVIGPNLALVVIVGVLIYFLGRRSRRPPTTGA
jgi:ATP-dependent Zn protease